MFAIAERRTIAALSATDEPPTESLSIEGAARRESVGDGLGATVAGRGGAGEGQGATTAGGDPVGAGPRGGGERVARNTAIFSILTMFSRVAGLGREILAASFFGTSGPASAFTLATPVPPLGT